MFEVSRRLVAGGCATTLLCTSVAGAPAEEVIDGIRVLRLGNRLAYYTQLPFAVRRRLRPDTVIIEHLCKLPFCTPLYAGVPTLAITHHLFGRTAFWQVPFAAAAAVVAAERLIPLCYRRCRFVAVSPSTKLDLIARGIAAERIRVIPNGVDADHYRPAAPPDGPPTLLVLGRVEPYKRIELVLQTFVRVRQRIPAARLVIVGGGTGLEQVRREIERLGLGEHVTCTGPVTETDKLGHIHAAHLVLNTSEKEGWGLTVLEAAACGLPTVASDVPGLRDAVVNGRTGILVPHGDVDALARVTVELLSDDERRQRLGRAARARAERFSWDSVAAATRQCIDEIRGAAPFAEPTDWFDDSGLDPVAQAERCGQAE